MHFLSFALLPLGGALIGWLTNWLAVRLLFRPYRSVRLPLIGYRFQGMLPKYRLELARNIGSLIQNELLPVDKLLNYLHSEEMANEMAHWMKNALKAKIADKIPSFLPLSVKNIVGDLIAEQIYKELPSLLDELVNRYGHKLKNESDLAAMIEDRLNGLELQHLENIIVKVAGKELRHIEVIGGLLGFLIGLFQIGLTLLFN